MEATTFSISPLISTSCNTNPHSNTHRLNNKTHLFNSASFTHKPLKFQSTLKWVVKAQAVDEDYELKQVKDMAAARKRWDALVREGKVKVLPPKEAGYAIQLSGKMLLDVRPSIEHEKRMYDPYDPYDVTGGLVYAIGGGVSLTTPLCFDTIDEQLHGSKGQLGSRSLTSILNLTLELFREKSPSYMMGGWWSGVPTLSFDNQFISKVTEKFPKDADLIVACQKGLRSLAACELLYNAGYENVFWVQGGLEAAEEEDLEREGPQPFKLAGVGGLSGFLGWTDQQRAQAAKEGWGYRLVFTGRLIGVILAADALFLAAQQAALYLQDIRAN